MAEIFSLCKAKNEASCGKADPVNELVFTGKCSDVAMTASNAWAEGASTLGTKKIEKVPGASFTILTCQDKCALDPLCTHFFLKDDLTECWLSDGSCSTSDNSIGFKYYRSLQLKLEEPSNIITKVLPKHAGNTANYDF